MTEIAKLRSEEAIFSALYELAVGIDVHEKKDGCLLFLFIYRYKLYLSGLIKLKMHV